MRLRRMYRRIYGLAIFYRRIQGALQRIVTFWLDDALLTVSVALLVAVPVSLATSVFVLCSGFLFCICDADITIL